MVNTTKVCSRCKQEKPASEFYKHWDKLQSYCKGCSIESATETQNTHREKYRILAKKRHAKVKLEALEYYGGQPPKCKQCGIYDTDVLCIDHINGGGKAHRQYLRTNGGTSIYYWLRRENYPEGYQVLCANCNLKKQVMRWGL